MLTLDSCPLEVVADVINSCLRVSLYSSERLPGVNQPLCFSWSVCCGDFMKKD